MNFMKIVLSLVFSLVLLSSFNAVAQEKAKPANPEILPAWTPSDGPLPEPFLKSTQGSKLEQITKNLRAALARPDMQGISASFTAIDLESGKTLVKHRGDELFIPASNQKILTTAAALHHLTPWYKFKTLLLSESQPDENGIISGNLYIEGGGDPWLVEEQVYRLASELRGKGITAIEGNLVIIKNFFDYKLYGPGFGNGASGRAYAAPQTGLSVNFNAAAVHVIPTKAGQPARVVVSPQSDYIQVKNTATTGGTRQSIKVNSVKLGSKTRFDVSGQIPENMEKDVTLYRKINHPEIFAGSMIKEALKTKGIKIKGKLTSSKALPANLQSIHELKSLPLSFMVSLTNKYSNNFMAEMILRTLGAEVKGLPGSWKKGQTVVSEFMQKQVKVSPKLFKIGNGSGMGDVNRLATSAIAKVLKYMWRHPVAGPEFVASNSVAGHDGTLEKWKIGSQLPGLLRAKTGTLSSTVALSGYLQTRNGRTLAVSILFNNCKGRNLDRLRVVQEEICLILADYNKKPAK